jgi:hypothetical protein
MPNGNVTVGGYAGGMSPAEQVLSTPANKLVTNSNGYVTVATNNDKSGYSLQTSEHTAIASSVWSATTRTLTSFGTLANDVASAVWSYTVEAGQSALYWLRLMGAAIFGRLNRSGNTYAFRDWNDSKNRIVGSVDNDGNRTITTRDGS